MGPRDGTDCNILLEKLDRYAAYYRSNTFSDGSCPPTSWFALRRIERTWSGGCPRRGLASRYDAMLPTTTSPRCWSGGAIRPYLAAVRGLMFAGHGVERNVGHLTPQERLERIARLLMRAVSLDDAWPDAARAPMKVSPRKHDSNGERPSRLRQGTTGAQPKFCRRRLHRWREL